MDLVAEIEKAKVRREELARVRDELWKKLDDHLANNKSVYDGERVIRAAIKECQAELYPIGGKVMS
jgi:hypothetical protein